MKWIAAAAGIVLLGGCSFLYEDTSESGQAEVVIDVTTADEPWEVAPMSGVNQEGDDISTESLEGDWWITKMVFTRCPTVCNVMSPNMSELQDELKEEDLDVQIVSFTVDPEFDTPERLKEYGESYNADFDSWDFVTGYDFDELQTFAQDSFSAQVMEAPEQDDIIHSTRFYLVDPDGVIHRMYAGEDSFDPERTIEDIEDVIQ
ncbi:SCO family protein [Alkalicoccus chagannorensis]|uniref:SCO family protein n=1 Tax=Alkalicoccus chagannorensis TaxID=427072 RepID=UPI00040C0806|nr:SCO family protein [Alkalicoccus chagannorensis]